MRKLKLILLTALTMFVGVNASANVDFTIYLGNLNNFANGGWEGNCANNHTSQEDGAWWNTQTGLSGGHSFRDGESWCPNVGSAGVMMGRSMVLPSGNYTLSFEAYGATSANASNPTAPAAGDVKAFFSGSNTKYDVTNTTVDDATYHNVTYTFDVTTDNTSYTFGIEKMSNGSTANWGRIRNVTLTLNTSATDRTELITNPGFEGNTTNNAALVGWEGSGTDGTAAFTSHTGNNSFDGAFAEMYGHPLTASNLRQTLSSLPAGVYQLFAKVNAGISCDLYASISDKIQKHSCLSGRSVQSLTFIVNETSDVTIGLKHDGYSGNSNVWVAVDCFKLLRMGDIGSANLTSQIVNPIFEDNFTGWTNDGMAIQDNTSFGKTGSKYAETWQPNGTKSVSQTISRLPLGVYRISAHSKARSVTSAKLFAGTKETAITIADIEDDYSVDFTCDGKSDITIGFQSVGTGVGASWICVDNFKLSSIGTPLEAAQMIWKEAYDAAVAARDASTYSNISGSERTTLGNAITSNASPTSSISAYESATEALISATSTFVNSKSNYDEYAAEAATAGLLGTDISGVSNPTTSAEALAAAHEINVLNYAKVVAEEYEDVSGSTLGAWTDVNVTSRRGQHWDGTTNGNTGTEYFEMNAGYGDTSWSMSRSQSVSLSAGKYILKVACRVSTYADATLSVTVGGSTISTISGHQGDNGKGITTGGVASYDEGTFANTTGRGFEWKYIPFEMAETGTATLSFTAEGHALYQYVSFTSLALLTDPKVAARTTLLNKINEANTAYNSGANVGTGVFQVPTAAGTTFSAAITTAQNVYDDDEATLSEIETATSTLNTALTAYQSTTLNAPSSSTRYKLTLADRGTLSFDATGAADEGGYGLPFATAADYMAQTFTLTHVSGNNYKLSFVDFDGNTRYICAGENAKEGIGNAKIRTTTDSSKALEITISATTTENVFNMLNSEDSNNKIGSNGGGMYTANDYTSWSISEASQATVNVTIDAAIKYGTRIFPFTPSLPDGVTAYSCGEADGAVLTLVEVAEPQANTPYILEALKGCASTNLEGWGTATASEYKAGWLTGVYTSRAATDGTYVLQNNGGKVGFYKVNTSVVTPTVGAYRCYLSVPSGARPAFFFGDETTGIGAINALTSGSATFYSVDGHQLPALQKGLNIVKTNGKTYKVMVK